MKLEYAEGATPLDPNEVDGLIPSNITTRGELDQWEQENILSALDWLSRKKPQNIISDEFLRELHKRMFDRVWKWAGKFRSRDKNIGIPHWKISEEVKKLCDDTSFWVKAKTFEPDGLAARFHHRLVSIHPFSNGNGRHGRLVTELIQEHILGVPRFSWGRVNLQREGEARQRYLTALKAADAGNFGSLKDFARS